MEANRQSGVLLNSVYTDGVGILILEAIHALKGVNKVRVVLGGVNATVLLLLLIHVVCLTFYHF